MPYHWNETPGTHSAQRLTLWPHCSLPPQGFVFFVGATCTLLLLPLLPLLGTVVLWGLLPFLLGAVTLLWWALRKNQRDRAIREELVLAPGHVHLHRHNPRGAPQEWECNSYWAQVTMHPSGGPVPKYVTLKGNGREVEIGAFLSEEERESLYSELQSRLAALR